MAVPYRLRMAVKAMMMQLGAGFLECNPSDGMQGSTVCIKQNY